MGNKIYKQSQMNKATSELECGNYAKALQLLKEEMKFYPRSQDALRLNLKVLFRLYELDKVDETYSRFYSNVVAPVQSQQQEDILTKALLVKETIFYDEAKARGLAKELLALIDRQKITASAMIQQNQQATSNFNNSTVINQQQTSLQQNSHMQSTSNNQNSNANNNNNNNNNNNKNSDNNNNGNSTAAFAVSNHTNNNNGNNNSSSVQNNNNNYSATTEAHPMNDSITFARSVVLLLDSQYEEAISVIQHEIISQGSSVSASLRFDAQILMIMAYNKQRQFKNSLALINDNNVQQACAGSKDKMFELNTMHGETLAAQAKIEQSIEKYKLCLDAIPSNTYVMYRLFNLCVRMNDLRGSRSFLDRALKVRPNDSLCAKMQGDQYIIQRDTRNAIKMYEKGISLNKKCYRCLESLGDVCSENQRLTCYEKCAKSNPCYTDVMIKIGIHYMQHSDDYLEALRWFFKALENRSQHKLIYFYIARSYYQNDQYEYALKNLGISLNITYEKINDQLSLAVKILNRYAEFFKVPMVLEFIESIRFKYFQYFLTISQNLENAVFAKLFSSFVVPTQVQVSFFALYKVSLARVQSNAEPMKGVLLQAQQQSQNISQFGSVQLNAPERSLFFSSRNIVDVTSPNTSAGAAVGVGVVGAAPIMIGGGFGQNKSNSTPLNRQAAEIAQKYFFDLFDSK